MVDSSGIGLLISAHNSLKKVGGQLAVIHASADVLELFQTMRMHQHFSVSGN
jgi:anti-anti-sigma factor